MGRSERYKWWIFAAVLGTVLGLDLATKSWALHDLHPHGPTRYLFGWLPLTLHFNTGGLWGVGQGSVSRWVFSIATVGALWLLIHLYRRTSFARPFRMVAIPMIAAGALGNLVDRLRWDHGVVDFIGPFDLGFMQWPIFNVADMAISCCTILLVLSLWREPDPAAHRHDGESEGTADATLPGPTADGR